MINMKYDNDFKIGFIRCKCGKSMVVKRKSFLNFKFFKGKCKHCGTKVRTRRIEKEKLIAKIIYWQRDKYSSVGSKILKWELILCLKRKL